MSSPTRRTSARSAPAQSEDRSMPRRRAPPSPKRWKSAELMRLANPKRQASRGDATFHTVPTLRNGCSRWPTKGGEFGHDGFIGLPQPAVRVAILVAGSYLRPTRLTSNAATRHRERSSPAPMSARAPELRASIASAPQGSALRRAQECGRGFPDQIPCRPGHVQSHPSAAVTGCESLPSYLRSARAR